MKIFPQPSLNNSVSGHTPDQAAIPSPEEWVQNHHLLADISCILSHFKLFSCEDEIAEEELIMSDKEWKILRENYSEEDWQYVQNYLLHLSGNS